MANIKLIILDVDGVIVGEKIGFNSPNPHPEVISKLKSIHEQGIPIVLCTAKPHFAIKSISIAITVRYYYSARYIEKTDRHRYWSIS